jgi:ureidoacrylate peracid hydrolase
MKVNEYTIRPALLVIDVQNGFAAKGGSYHQLGIDISNYIKVIPKIADIISVCRESKIPIFYTQAIREPSGIDLLTNVHRILPKSREERIKMKPICVRGTWDAQIVDEIMPTDSDHVIRKRRDSAFYDTEIGVWLKSAGIDTLIFCGIDTSISVESSLRDAFNLGYDVILMSDATASNIDKHYQSTLENVRGYYGLVMSTEEFSRFAFTDSSSRSKSFEG